MEKIHPLLNKDKQKIAKVYEREKRILGIFTTLLSVIFQIYFYFSGLAHNIACWNVFSSFVWTFIVFMIIYSILQDIIQLPISYSSDFTLEHKYGFSKQTNKEWLWDHIKGFLLSLIFSILDNSFKLELHWAYPCLKNALSSSRLI